MAERAARALAAQLGRHPDTARGVAPHLQCAEIDTMVSFFREAGWYEAAACWMQVHREEEYDEDCTHLPMSSTVRPKSWVAPWAWRQEVPGENESTISREFPYGVENATDDLP